MFGSSVSRRAGHVEGDSISMGVGLLEQMSSQFPALPITVLFPPTYTTLPDTDEPNNPESPPEDAVENTVAEEPPSAA